MKTSIIILASLLFFGLSLSTISVQAQSATPGVTKRQVKQQARIQQGKKSGELTKPETVKLQAQQAHIKRSKKRAKADGVVTRRERAKLHRKQNRASRNIKSEKHDRQDRN